MIPIEEVKEWLIENRTDENGDLDLSGLDFSDFEGNVRASGWKVRKSLDQSRNEVGGDLHQDNQKVGGSLHQGNQQAGWMEQGAACQGPTQGERKMTPKEKGQFLLKYFKTEDGALELDRVDLSDFHGDVVLEGWKVGGDLFLDHQEVMGSLFQNNQKVRRNLFQDEQEAGGCIAQDMQEPNAQEAEGIPIGPDYEAEYGRLQKELCEANGKIETLMWALGKAKEACE